MAKVISIFTKQEIPSYWIPTEIPPYCEGLVTLGKRYKIYYDEWEDDEYIISDVGSKTNLFIVCKGEYI